MEGRREQVRVAVCKLVVGSEVILLDRESEEAAAEDALGRTWSWPSVRRHGWFLLDRGIMRFS